MGGAPVKKAFRDLLHLPRGTRRFSRGLDHNSGWSSGGTSSGVVGAAAANSIQPESGAGEQQFMVTHGQAQGSVRARTAELSTLARWIEGRRGRCVRSASSRCQSSNSGFWSGRPVGCRVPEQAELGWSLEAALLGGIYSCLAASRRRRDSGKPAATQRPGPAARSRRAASCEQADWLRR
ncbi:hypothetical protein BRADI_1g24786v3 [Brachypodium distachyon]|uniref:Uncharacterized protein n=1 Tax=Brachypodium distachyon TaxID=15368 RepID=A0A0Q3GXN1_BRADI|nr:hypothetical protein BRADI_1g24786v3 [Brachypodium distachyon]